jgi:hypothetical protein
VKHGLAVVLGLALLAHGVGLRNGFVYDDHRFILENHALATASVSELVLDPATQTSDEDRDIYRPLRALGFALDMRRWGSEPFGFHLHSLIAHLVTVGLAFACLRRLVPSESDAPALLGAGMLAMHPLGVEVVGWVTSRGDVYALGLALAALWVATLAEAPDRSRARRGALDAATLLLALLATMGKESALWLPAVAAGRILLLRNGRWAGVCALALGVGAALVLRQWALSNLSPVQTTPHGGTWFHQAGWALYGTGRTFGSLALPTGLSVEYAQHGWVAGGSVWVRLPTLAALAVIGLAVGLRRRAPVAAFALAWMLFAYLPSSSLLVTLRSLLNDRAAYPMLPGLGVLLAVPLGAHRGALRAALLGAAVVLVPLSIQRTGVFLDDRSLWLDVAEKQPLSMRAYLGLAAAVPDDDPDAREQLLRTAVSAAPTGTLLEGIARGRLGDFLLGVRGAPDLAMPELIRALDVMRHRRERNRPGADEAVTASALAEAMALTGQYERSDALLMEVLREQPGRLMLHVKRGALGLFRHEQTGDPVALDVVQAAVTDATVVQPDHPLVQALARRLAERRALGD